MAERPRGAAMVVRNAVDVASASSTVSWQSVHHVSRCTTPPCTTPTSTRRISTNMDPIEAAIAEIESLQPGENFSYREIARRYDITHTTLIRRHQGVTQSGVTTVSPHQNLTPEQEVELVRYITRLTERGLPPTRQIMQNFASTITKKQVSLSWVDRFIKRNAEDLIYR